MKKIKLGILCTCILICLCGCGKSEAVKNAESAISSIGEVSLDSAESIKYAEKLYGILTDSEKEKVDNRIVLIEARESFDKLEAEYNEKVMQENKKKIFENAKKAYENLTNVAGTCVTGMDSIYGAWHFGIYEADDCASSSRMSKLASASGLSSSKIQDACKALGLDKYDLDDWNNCVIAVMKVYQDSGTIKLIEQYLEETDTILRELNSEYSDYEYYPTLKEYYSKVSSYVDFFKSPTGSFKQLADTINDYENNIRTYQNDLEFLFK